jgi:protein-S-isoprenylcysteine O-methyltransferase Ste14
MHLYFIADTINRHKESFDGYLSRKEGFDDDDKDKNKKVDVAGMKIAIGLLLAILLLAIIFFIVVLVVLIKHWHLMPQWAQIIAVLFLVLPLPGGMFVTLILALVARENGASPKKTLKD